MTPQPADGEVHQRLGCEEMTFRVSDAAGDPASRGQWKAPDDGEGVRWPRAVSASDCSPLTALSPATHVPALLAPARQSIVLSCAFGGALELPESRP